MGCGASAAAAEPGELALRDRADCRIVARELGRVAVGKILMRL